MDTALEESTVISSCGEYTRTVWFLPSLSDQPHPLCLFLDAEHYLRDMRVLPIIAGLIGSGAIPPVTCAFVSHVNGAARHADLTCNESYARFIAEDVVARARQRDPNIQSGENIICGLSLSGLAGAHIAFRYPDTFSFALCQSGSFWWLADNDVSLPPTRTKFWLSVGDQERDIDVTHPPSGLHQRVSQIEGVEAAARRFEELGGTVNYAPYSGGHAIAPWREELGPALAWLIGECRK